MVHNTRILQARLTNLGHGFGVAFRALRVRNYRLFWLGLLVSLIGTWMQTTAQQWEVFSLTKSPMALGIVTALQFLPIMVLSLFGGVIADRVPKRRVLFFTQSAALIQATVFGALVATGLIQLWQIYLLAMAQGIINAIDNPVRQAFASELVSKDDRPNAIALNSMLFNGARVIGPALAGVIIAVAGTAAALFLNALSFLAVLAALTLMRPAEFYIRPHRNEEVSPMSQLAEGLRYSRNTPAILVVLIVVAFIGTFGYNFSVVLPLIGGFVLNTDAAGFGALSSALGLGALVGSAVAAFAKSVSMRRVMLGSVGFSLLLAAVALSTHMALSLVLLAGLGLCGVIFSTSANTTLQNTAPDHLRGRVISLYFLLFAGSTPIGAALIGSLSSALNVTDALLICAGLCLFGLALAQMYYVRRVRPSTPAATR